MPLNGFVPRLLWVGTLLSALAGCSSLSAQHKAIDQYCMAEATRLYPPIHIFLQQSEPDESALDTPNTSNTANTTNTQQAAIRVCTVERNPSLEEGLQTAHSKNPPAGSGAKMTWRCDSRPVSHSLDSQPWQAIPGDNNRPNRQAFVQSCRADALAKGMYRQLNQH